MENKMSINYLIIVMLLTFSYAVKSEPWKFGLIADTQWSSSGDSASGYKNPNSVAVDIINQINREFVNNGVKFVIAVGDLTDEGTKLALDTRATYAQALYNAGIGLYPLRGNHEGSSDAAVEFLRVFPQTKNGSNNCTPSDAFVYTDSAQTHPVKKSGTSFVVGKGFNSPSTPLAGLSYAFTYNNATFILLDQFTPPDSSVNTVAAQQHWIDSVLSNRPAGTHAFVFGHRGLINEYHANVLFSTESGNPSDDPAGVDAFIKSLAKNNVHYFMCGHDHLHNRAIVTTTDGVTAKVQNIILTAGSYKFYQPVHPSNDSQYDVPAFGHTREMPIAQDYITIGYYIVTVDSPSVIVDYYAVPSGEVDGFIVSVPPLTGNWTKRETFGYSLNGKEFAVPQGSPYTSVVDSFSGTKASILGGVNSCSDTDFSGRPFTQVVGTGWKLTSGMQNFYSNIVTIWGMTPINATHTDSYALAVSYSLKALKTDLVNGAICLASKAADGKWGNIVNLNIGGTKKFVLGPWNRSYTLGTYGIDTLSHTAWAVINYTGDFAIAKIQTSGTIQFIYTSDPHYGIFRDFRGAKNATAQKVNQAMIAKINRISSMTHPADSGVNAGTAVGGIDYLIETGDLCNRQDSVSAKTSYQRDSISWNQFKADYLDGITLKNSSGQNTGILLSPGNHDVTNAIGYYNKMVPATDPTSMVNMYNMMMNPNVPRNNTTYNYTTDKIHYSTDIGGVHLVFVNMWPDSAERIWLTSDLAVINPAEPVLLFAHDPPDVDARHFTNPNGTHSINNIDKFENLLAERFKDGTSIDDNTKIEQKALANYLTAHPSIKAYFHGHDNANEFYTWNGVNVFRVDSPMKGNVSESDESMLSFQLVTIDTLTKRMTVRECLWNDSSSASSPVKWGAHKTISLTNGDKVIPDKSSKLKKNTGLLMMRNMGSRLVINCSMTKPSMATISIVNIQGRTIRTFILHSNERSCNWDYKADGAIPGMYLITLKTDKLIETAQFNLVR